MKKFLCSFMIVACFALTAKCEPNGPTAKPSDSNKPVLQTYEPNTLDIINSKLMTLKSCVELSNKAGRLLQESKIEDAYKILQNHNVSFINLGEQKNLFLASFNAMLQQAIPTIGRQIPDGFEYIGVLKFNESLIGVYYLSKHQFAGILWKFVYYKPYDEWKFLDFGFGPENAGDVVFLAKPVQVDMGSN